jgi:putative peptidoglycan lipid II flippase
MLSHVHGTPDTFTLLGWTIRYPLEEGALSAVTYAQRLSQFPLGVLVLSLATAALPAFSRMAARAEWPAWAAEVRQSLRLAVFEGVLAGVMMIMLAAPLVRLLFERGRFTPDDTQRAAFVVVWYGVGLWAFCAQHIVLRGFYSLGDVRTPLTISVVLLPLNVLLNVTLVWLPAIREAAFAIATATTSALAVVIGLLVLQRRSHTAVLDGRTLGALARMLLAGAAAAAVLHYAIPVLTPLAAQLPQRLAARATETFGLLALGTAAYLLAAWLLRLDELRLLLARGRRGSRPGAAPHAP